MPKSNREFWEKKLNSNVARDRRADIELADSGWNVVRFWEHSVSKDLDSCVKELIVRLGRNL